MTDRIPSASPGASAGLRGLARARSTTGEMAQELLSHLPEVGDATTQSVLDAWVEQAADTLRAVSGALEDRLLELGRDTGDTTVTETRAPRSLPSLPSLPSPPSRTEGPLP